MFHTLIKRIQSAHRVLSTLWLRIGYLRWYGTLKYGDFHEKFNFLKIQDLRPLNTSQKHFEMIMPNFSLDECEIEEKYTVV